MLDIDLAKKRIVASVRHLIEDPLEVPRAAGVLVHARTALGTDIHRAWRAEREAADTPFEAEVHLVLEHEVDGFALKLRGRADGVSKKDEGTVVEEVKSVEDDAASLSDATLPEYADAALQVKLYALMLSAQRPDAEVAARLVLVSIVDGSERTLSVPFESKAVTRTLNRLLRKRIEAAQEARELALHRAAVAARLLFPYGEERPYQPEFSAAVAEGLETGRPVLAMAPTGIGKTVGALLPALRYSLTNDALLFFLTAKTTQQALVATTFRDIARASACADGDLRALTFREKRRMCPTGTLLCHPDHCEYLEGFLQKNRRENAVDALLHETVHLDPETVYAVGEKRTLCPYALALTLSLRVDLVICDVNYVYDPAVSFGLFREEARTRDVVAVIDEAHNLFDRAREYYSPFVKRSDVARLGERVVRGEFLAPRKKKKNKAPAGGVLPGLGVAEGTSAVRANGVRAGRTPAGDDGADGAALFADMAEHLARVASTMDRIGREAAEQHPSALDACRPVRRPVPAWELPAAQAAGLMVRYGHYQQVHGLVRADDDLLGVLATEMAVQGLLETDAPEFVPYAAASDEAPDGAGFGILCVNPAEKLAERHARVLGTVAMSATLHPLPYYTDVLGFGGMEPIQVSLPSPFPEENRCVATVTDVGTTWRERRRHYERIAGFLESLVELRPGNYVAYFPSFRFLEDVQKHLRLPKEGVLVQERRMAGERRAEMLEQLADTAQPTLLLAVMGGIFAEGIDLPGEGLVGAVVVGPGLPQVGFERTLMQHYFDEKLQRGFAYAMLFPGMQRVIQAAGRVHRTPDDQGVIVLIGRRFASFPYVDCLPSHWYRYGPEELSDGDPIDRLRRFWDA